MGLPTGPKASFLMISENPMIAFKGVRSSWLMVARNSPFVRSACSAAFLAVSS